MCQVCVLGICAEHNGFCEADILFTADNINSSHIWYFLQFFLYLTKLFSFAFYFTDM